jgi:hypothetical protein
MVKIEFKCDHCGHNEYSVNCHFEGYPVVVCKKCNKEEVLLDSADTSD